MKLAISFALALSTMVGCAGSSDGGEAVGGDEAAFTQSSAFNAIVGKTFVSGHCGFSLTLSRGGSGGTNTGLFRYRLNACDSGSTLEETGTFKISGALLGGTVTDASLDLTTSNGNRWSYDVEEAPEPDGNEPSAMPKGTPTLNGDAAHGDRLFPEEFLD